MLRWQGVHDVSQVNFPLLTWWRFAQKTRRVGNEAVNVHLREVDSGVLTRRGEDYHGQEVGKILTGREGCWETFIHAPITLSLVAVVMEITGPVPQLCILENGIRRKFDAFIIFVLTY